MRLRRPCQHVDDEHPEGRYEEHNIWGDDRLPVGVCLGGVFLADDALVIERGPDGKFPEWITDPDGPVWFQCGDTDDLLEGIFQAIQIRVLTVSDPNQANIR